mgnify:CR=1 FL=1
MGYIQQEHIQRFEELLWLYVFTPLHLYNSTSLPLYSSTPLQHVPQLFFDFLQFVFHLHHELLYAYMVGFGAGGVDFAAHLLGYEAQLFAAGGLVGHGLAEVVDVFLQAHFLFGDVEFFQIVDEFLFESVGVHLDGGFGEVAFDALLGGVYAFAFEGGDLVQLGFDEVYMLVEVHGTVIVPSSVELNTRSRP